MAACVGYTYIVLYYLPNLWLYRSDVANIVTEGGYGDF